MSTFALHCLLLGEDPDQIFTIEIDQNETIGMLKNAIKRRDTVLADVGDATLILLNVSLPLDYADLDAQWRIIEHGNCMWPPLSPSDMKLSSFFTQDDPQGHYLHILVKHPLSPEELALKRQPVIDQRGPPPSDYHPVFAKFQQELDKSESTPEELRTVYNFTVDSLQSYDDVHARIAKIEDNLRKLVGADVLSNISITDCGRGRSFQPHGVMGCQCKQFPAKDFGVYAFTEISNGFGEGPILRAQRDYVNYYSAKSRKSIRNACCCPAFLIVIAGSYLVILGATVVDDRFMSYHLTSFMGLGGIMNDVVGQVYETAKILKLLKSCLLDLDEFYTNLLPPVCHASPHTEQLPTELPRSSNTLSRLYGKHLDRLLVHGDTRPHNIISDIGHSGEQDNIDLDLGGTKLPFLNALLTGQLPD